MGKYKAYRKKPDLPPQMKPGVPCLVIIVGAMIGTVLIMILVMRNAG